MKKSLKIITIILTIILFQGISFAQNSEIDGKTPDDIYKTALEYLSGINKSQNTNKAVELLIAAANAGKTEACDRLVEVYTWNKRPTDAEKWKANKLKIEKNKKEAELKEKAKKQSENDQQNFYTKAQENLFVDRNLSLEYYKKAATATNGAKSWSYYWANYDLGVIYAEGKLVKRDIEKAEKLFKIALESNDSSLQYNIGRHYLIGEIIPKNKHKALVNLNAAARQGDKHAEELIFKIQN